MHADAMKRIEDLETDDAQASSEDEGHPRKKRKQNGLGVSEIAILEAMRRASSEARHDDVAECIVSFAERLGVSRPNPDSVVLRSLKAASEKNLASFDLSAPTMLGGAFDSLPNRFRTYGQPQQTQDSKQISPAQTNLEFARLVAGFCNKSLDEVTEADSSTDWFVWFSHALENRMKDMFSPTIGGQSVVLRQDTGSLLEDLKTVNAILDEAKSASQVRILSCALQSHVRKAVSDMERYTDIKVEKFEDCLSREAADVGFTTAFAQLVASELASTELRHPKSYKSSMQYQLDVSDLARDLEVLRGFSYDPKTNKWSKRRERPASGRSGLFGTRNAIGLF